MTSWQPIETAPKDETPVILYIPPGTYRSGFMCSAHWTKHNIEYWHVDDNKNEPYPLRGGSPTHWHLLPEPPQ